MLRLRASEALAASARQTEATVEQSPCDIPATTFPAIDAYVAELGAGLHSACSTGLATGTCEEIRQHLVATADALIELGESAEEAERQAVVRFGSVGEHRRALTGELRQTTRRTNPQAAFCFALALYGGVFAFDLLCLILFALSPCAASETLLPHYQIYATSWLLVGSPLITGCILGRQTGRLAVSATWRAQLPIVGSLLLASGIAHLAIILKPTAQWPVYLPFSLTCYYGVRFALSLLAAGLTGRPRRRSLLLARA